MKRLPSISNTPNNTADNAWKRVRRHSEPPNKHQITPVLENHLTPIHEKPVFSNSFLALEEEEGENKTNIEILVSPLSNDHLTLPPKRTRSQSGNNNKQKIKPRFNAL